MKNFSMIRGKNGHDGKVFCWILLLVPWFVAGCGRVDSSVDGSSIRLAHIFDPEKVENKVTPQVHKLAQSEWTFDGSMPVPVDTTPAETLGWKVGLGIEALVIEEGRLTGKTTMDFPILYYQRTEDVDDPDELHSIEIRMKVSQGKNCMINFSSEAQVAFDENAIKAMSEFWTTSTPIVAGEEFQTYTIQPQIFTPTTNIRNIMIRPTDAQGAEFAIESIKLVFRHEYLDRIPSGISWQGLKEIYQETMVSRAPEKIHFQTRMPDDPFLDVSLGIFESIPVTFSVTVQESGVSKSRTPARVLERTVTMPLRWEPARIDLSDYAGREVTMTFALESRVEGSIGFWGSPVIRNRISYDSSTDAPQGVIVIWCETLRWDHLNFYGYHRETAPNLTRMASEGVLFEDCLTQATWTKVSTPSLMTSLYPNTHGVRTYTDRISASITTLAEVFHEWGYATLSLSSIPFTGKFTNLHQGFEQLHESGSYHDQEYHSKTSREYMDRLLPWLESHRDVPFFVFFHVADPHDPFEPRPPFNTIWGNPSHKKKLDEQLNKVQEFIQNPLMKQFKMPTLEEFKKTGYDPDEFIRMEKDQYDGSIRGMDAEMGRLFERLKELGIDDRILVVFTSDHGEEFFDHGRTFHGHSVYSELNHVPLAMRWSGVLPRNITVSETVRTIDIMPTLLELCRLPIPEECQGQSLVPLIRQTNNRVATNAASRHAGLAHANDEWVPVVAVTEQHETEDPPMNGESYGMVVDGWKLVHYTIPIEGRPVTALYDHKNDPLDQVDLAEKHPDKVEELMKLWEDWKAETSAAAERIATDESLQHNVSADELNKLRSLGYIQ